MLDKNADIMKTFNDYSEEGNIQFGEILVSPGDNWDGKEIRELGLPGKMLIVLVERNEEHVRPYENTKLLPGDRVVTLTHSLHGSQVSLYEKRIKPGSRRIGQPLKAHPGTGLVVMIRRGKENIIPQGDSILQEGDILVILNL
jgi:cell volume regulation protein A